MYAYIKGELAETNPDRSCKRIHKNGQYEIGCAHATVSLK